MPNLVNPSRFEVSGGGGTTTNYSFESDADGFKATALLDTAPDDILESAFSSIPNGTSNTLIQRNSGSTPSSGTGPSSAQDGTWYIYSEGSGDVIANRGWCILIPGTWDGSTNIQIDYYISQITDENMATLWQYLPSGGNFETDWVDIGVEDRGSTSGWESRTINTGSIGAGVRLRFWFLKHESGGTNFRNDQAIDNITITED